MRILKSIIKATVLGVMLTACAQNTAPTQSAANDVEMVAPVLTIITRQDPETQLMALILSKAAFDQGSPVRVLLCDKGGDLALKSPTASAKKPLKPKNMSPSGLLTKLIESGVQVDVCAIYLPNRSFGKEALLESIGVATPVDVAQFYTQNDTKILAF